MKEKILDVIVIGAGPAGLSTSFYLQQNGLEHLVLERGKAGESWRSQRWNGFRLNSPNRLNELPHHNNFHQDPEGFCTSREYVNSLESYIHKFQLPVVENTLVESVQKENGSDLFTVRVVADGIEKNYYCKNLVVASGSQSECKLPAVCDSLPDFIHQLHAGEYRNSVGLPEGNVLVVGSAQSGCQIADDLAVTKRKVFLSTSMVPRVPRNYRGKDIHDWLLQMKFFDQKKEEITDQVLLHLKAPHLTGVGHPPRTISLQALAKKGVCIMGKLKSGNQKELFFEPNAADHVRFADGFSLKVKSMIDQYISQTEIQAPATIVEEEDWADENAECAANAEVLDLRKENIQTIIWATGFHSNLRYLKFPVLDADGFPLCKDGISSIEGLYFIGFPWLRNRKSSLICGIVEDAKFIGDRIRELVLSKEKEWV